MESLAVFAVGGIIGMAITMLVLVRPINTAKQILDDDKLHCYLSGVEDGYGYGQSPWDAEYSRAGEYLKDNCKHIWPELADEEEID